MAADDWLRPAAQPPSNAGEADDAPPGGCGKIAAAGSAKAAARLPAVSGPLPPIAAKLAAEAVAASLSAKI